MKFEKHIDIKISDQKVVDVLSKEANLSKQLTKQAMKKGAVWLSRNNATQRIRRADKLLIQNDCLHIYYNEDVLSKKPDNAILIADEGQYSIWCKPYGMLSQGSKWGDHCTINRWVETNLEPQRSAFIVNRLDRAASGLMIIAHKKTTAAYFSKLFQQRQIDKHYQAIVRGCFPERKDINTDIDDKPAISHVKKIKYNKELDQSLLEVTIETGRKHQIRKHLSESGYPIIGDRLYGNGTEEEIDLCLISCYLEFKSPNDDLKKVYKLPDYLLNNV
jgi:tRNA pseudouridine32 synthase / 23S rRNA pseudouridine746 synthase